MIIIIIVAAAVAAACLAAARVDGVVFATSNYFPPTLGNYFPLLTMSVMTKGLQSCVSKVESLKVDRSPNWLRPLSLHVDRTPSDH